MFAIRVSDSLKIMLCLALLPRQRENYLWACTIRAFRRKETADADERQIEQGKPSDWLFARFQEQAPQDRDVTIEKMLGWCRPTNFPRTRQQGQTEHDFQAV